MTMRLQDQPRQVPDFRFVLFRIERAALDDLPRAKKIGKLAIQFCERASRDRRVIRMTSWSPTQREEL